MTGLRTAFSYVWAAGSALANGLLPRLGATSSVGAAKVNAELHHLGGWGSFTAPRLSGRGLEGWALGAALTRRPRLAFRGDLAV